MSVKILHASDFHLDSPFEALPPSKAAIRRSEQRGLLDKIVELVAVHDVQLVLLSGDLLDSASSYYETQESLYRTFASMKVPIVIAPGNHDYYCAKSPYASMTFPQHVHIFKSSVVSCLTLPELGCRVWGAAFNDAYAKPLLTGFRTPDDASIDIMVMHGDIGISSYNPIREADIASSGLDYLALGHIHTFSGIRRAGKTDYAYPGTPEGRGFDETGEKGVIIGSVDKTVRTLRFVPIAGRRYQIHTVDLSGCTDIPSAVSSVLPAKAGRDICRLILSGETDMTVDLKLLYQQLSPRFFHLTIQDQTRPARDIWAAAGDDTLRGIFIRRLKERYDHADGSEKDMIICAVRCGLSALDNREGYEA